MDWGSFSSLWTPWRAPGTEKGQEPGSIPPAGFLLFSCSVCLSPASPVFLTISLCLLSLPLSVTLSLFISFPSFCLSLSLCISAHFCLCCFSLCVCLSSFSVHPSPPLPLPSPQSHPDPWCPHSDLAVWGFQRGPLAQMTREEWVSQPKKGSAEKGSWAGGTAHVEPWGSFGKWWRLVLGEIGSGWRRWAGEGLELSV